MTPTRRVVRLLPDTTLDEAEALRRVEDPRNYSMALLTEGEFMGVVATHRKHIVEDLILEESMTLINGTRGCGKSWFCLAMANEVTWGGEFGYWKCPNPVTTLYVDGEMPFSLLQERMDLLNEGRDIHTKPAELFLYPESYAYRIGLKRADILDKVWRSRIADCVMDLGVKLLILDNLSSLAPGIDENDKLGFDPVNRWLLELRFHKVSIVMAHHTGKSGEQRGTSAHEDHVDTSFLLAPLPSQTPNTHSFKLTPTKDRANITGNRSRSVILMPDSNGRLSLKKIDKPTGGPGKVDQVYQELRVNPAYTLEQAMEDGASRATYFRAKEKWEKSEGGT